MTFTVDVGELAVVLELDTEPAEVDLTRAGLGDACLDAAVEGMLASDPFSLAGPGKPARMVTSCWEPRVSRPGCEPLSGIPRL